MNLKSTHKPLGAVWMLISVYFFATLTHGIYRVHSQPLWVSLELFYVLLYVLNIAACVFLFAGAKWARTVVGLVALLTVSASVTGFFAWFNQYPFSFVGIMFDIFSGFSAIAFLSFRRPAMARQVR
jgi:hypothetical protein